jgi:hypothetical protein
MMQLDIDLAGTEFIRPDVADMASRRKVSATESN